MYKRVETQQQTNSSVITVNGQKQSRPVFYVHIITLCPRPLPPPLPCCPTILPSSLLVPLYCPPPSLSHCAPFLLLLLSRFSSLSSPSCFSHSSSRPLPPPPPPPTSLTVLSSYSLRIAYHLQTYPILMKHPNI